MKLDVLKRLVFQSNCSKCFPNSPIYQFSLFSLKQKSETTPKLQVQTKLDSQNGFSSNKLWNWCLMSPIWCESPFFSRKKPIERPTHQWNHNISEKIHEKKFKNQQSFEEAIQIFGEYELSPLNAAWILKKLMESKTKSENTHQKKQRNYVKRMQLCQKP